MSSEEWAGVKSESKARRADNRAKSADILTDNDIKFTSHNGGTHLVVEARVDFWPGTGLWMVRNTKIKRRGVFNLLKYLKEN